MRFLFGGEIVQPDQTPIVLGMEDGDVIDCIIEQVGDIGQWEALPSLVLAAHSTAVSGYLYV